MNTFSLTTSIAYANSSPHIGFALELVQADVVARLHRLRGERVHFLTGTDEHGSKIARAAAAAGTTPQHFVDTHAQEFQRLKSVLNLSWDDFIRTSDRKRHWPGAQKLWTKLAAAGDLYKKTYRGLYCVGHEAFVTEKDLVDGKCPDHQKAPEVFEEENWFFKLSRYTDEIKRRIASDELRVVPTTRKNEILSLLEQGLEDISFSRPRKNIEWGIPVPGDPDQTLYVWCDALANYITAIGYAEEGADFKKWWPADLHCIGKDILRFHAAIWPAMLLSAQLPLPKEIFVHGFITANGQKISKSLGNTVDPVELVQKYGTDAVRYYLLRGISADGDGDYSEEKFKTLYNADLANGLGNLVQRVTTLAQKAGLTDITQATGRFELLVSQTKKDITKAFEHYRFDHALETIWKLVTVGDGYVNETKVWEKSGKEQQIILADLSSLILTIANLLQLFLPVTAEEIVRRFGLTLADLRTERIKSLSIVKGEPLFVRFL